MNSDGIALNEKPYLILTVGLPQAGKSTWALESGHPIVSPDAIRLLLCGQRFNADFEPIVWNQARWMVRSLFAAGHQVVVLDACSHTEQRRQEWDDEGWTTIAYQFFTSKEECLQRAKAAGRTDLIAVIEHMAREFEPLPKENFKAFDELAALAVEKWGDKPQTEGP